MKRNFKRKVVQTQQLTRTNEITNKNIFEVFIVFNYVVIAVEQCIFNNKVWQKMDLLPVIVDDDMDMYLVEHIVNQLIDPIPGLNLNQHVREPKIEMKIILKQLCHCTPYNYLSSIFE